MYKVLIAEEKKQVREILRIALSGEGYELLEAKDGAEALILVASVKPDVVLLDAELPGLNGVEVCKQLRSSSNLPIIVLVSKGCVDIGIQALDLGADDYLVKPLNTREVLARLRAVLRRVKRGFSIKARQPLHYEGLDVDVEAQSIKVFGCSISLTAKEMELLWFLAAHANRTFSRAQLLQSIWGHSYCGDTRTVDTHIKKLRQKLNVPESSSWKIVTIWGIGYQFELKTRPINML